MSWVIVWVTVSGVSYASCLPVLGVAITCGGHYMIQLKTVMVGSWQPGRAIQLLYDASVEGDIVHTCRYNLGIAVN